jgi:hypothetical protein
MQDVRVDPRTTAELPIVANISENVQYKGIRPLELAMQTYQRHFYADSLRVIGGTGELVSQTVDGDVRTITFRMNVEFTNRENIIAYVIRYFCTCIWWSGADELQTRFAAYCKSKS